MFGQAKDLLHTRSSTLDWPTDVPDGTTLVIIIDQMKDIGGAENSRALVPVAEGTEGFAVADLDSLMHFLDTLNFG